MLALAAIISVSSNLGYLLPAIIGLESMGVPSPGETALVTAAVLASQGTLKLWLVMVIGISSAIIGDNIGYWLGRRFGREVLEARGPFLSHRLLLIRSGDQFFQKHGGKTVFLARWIALIRVAAAWLAGINRMPVKQFFIWNAFGGITWGITFSLVGYYGGRAGAHVLSRLGVAGAIVLAVMLVAGILLLRRRERRERRRLASEAARDQASSREPSGSSSSAHELMQ
jgi:membrane protein DedA with SNARE-associated domain